MSPEADLFTSIRFERSFGDSKFNGKMSFSHGDDVIRAPKGHIFERRHMCSQFVDYFWALLCTYYLKHTTNHDALKKSVFLTVMTSSTARRANFYTHIHYHDTSWCFDNDFSSLKRILHLLYTQNKPFFKFLQFFYYDVINRAL